jgi:hypothetical protein
MTSKTPMTSKTVDALHNATHRVPGVPAHNDSAPSPHGVNRHPRLQNRNAHHESQPRVFVAWQNWIARLVRGRS